MSAIAMLQETGRHLSRERQALVGRTRAAGAAFLGETRAAGRDFARVAQHEVRRWRRFAQVRAGHATEQLLPRSIERQVLARVDGGLRSLERQVSRRLHALQPRPAKAAKLAKPAAPRRTTKAALRKSKKARANGAATLAGARA